jgi:hypothetical protein
LGGWVMGFCAWGIGFGGWVIVFGGWVMGFCAWGIGFGGWVIVFGGWVMGFCGSGMGDLFTCIILCGSFCFISKLVGILLILDFLGALRLYFSNIALISFFFVDLSALSIIEIK